MKQIIKGWTNLRKFLNFAFKPKGFSLVEVLIGSSLILVNLGVLSSALVQYGEVSKKQKVITLAMNLEAALHRAVSDPVTYAGIVDTLITTGFPNPFTLSIPVDMEGAPVPVILIFPGTGTRTVYLNRQMADCGSDFTNINCVIFLEIANTGAPPTYSFAYRITINPDLHIAMPPLGIKESGAFTTNRAGNSDYKLYIPQYILSSDSFSSCSPATTAALTGYDRLSGAANCLIEPIDDTAERCDTNEIAKGLTVILSGGNYRIIPRCVPARSFVCPPQNANNDVTAAQVDYSMLVYDPRGLDSNYAIGTTNKCVFTAMSPATDPTPPSNFGTTLNVPQACPNPYRITTPNPYGCSAAGVVTVSQGSCRICTTPNPPYACAGWTNYSYNSESYNVSGVPVMSGGDVVGANCTLSDSTPFPPAAHPACEELLSNPTVNGTLTLNATCDLKPSTGPMIIDAIIE